MDRAARDWARRTAEDRLDVLRIAYFGSYARGDWAVGSDLDLLILVKSSRVPLFERSLDFDVSTLPVPAEALVYTCAEWEALARRSTRFYQTIEQEAVLIFKRS